MEAVRLRPLRLEDASSIYASIEESRAEIARWMDWCRPGYDLVATEKWIAATARARQDGTGFEFGIFGPQGFLGTIGVNQINPHERFANVGYWVRTSATGRGTATAAVKLVAQWAFLSTELQRLEIVAAVDNAASRRVAEKAGAAREGRLRSRICVCGKFYDAFMFSIVRGDRL